jgi:hypothetical protein
VPEGSPGKALARLGAERLMSVPGTLGSSGHALDMGSVMREKPTLFLRGGPLAGAPEIDQRVKIAQFPATPLLSSNIRHRTSRFDRPRLRAAGRASPYGWASIPELRRCNREVQVLRVANREGRDADQVAAIIE